MLSKKIPNTQNTQNTQNIIYKYWDSPNNTRIKSIKYYSASGKLHRPYTEGPAVIEYFNTPDNNNIANKKYYKNGKLYRPWREGPAIQSYYKNAHGDSRIKTEEYYESDTCYRPPKEGAIFIEYSNTPDNSVLCEEY